MAKQLNVSLGFTADTSQAKAQLQDLQRQLDSLIKSSATSTKGLGLTQDLMQATASAAELKSMLASATLPSGKLDLGLFNQSLNASGKKLQDYATDLNALGPTGQKTFANIARAITTAELPLRRTNGLLSEFAVTLKNTARWQISSSILHGFMGAVQSAYGYAQDLNESLTNIRIVTGASVEEMDRFAEKANKAARALSASTTAYTDAALIFYQQGLSDSEVEERTNVTIKMSHAAGESAEEVSSYMTAIWNNFDDGSKSLEYYGDVMQALGAKTAASSAEIAEGLEKFAAIGETVGLSYEYATAAVATVVDKTRQSADTVGTAFKTIFARLQGLQLGETLEDGVDLNKYSKALKSVGIEILDLNGNLKQADVIIDELGATWNTLTTAQQTALAQTVAGTRQYTQLMSLMNNFNDFQGNVDIAKGSEGALDEAAEIYAESWEGAKERVTAAAQSIYKELLNDKFFIGLTNVFEKLLVTIKGTIDGLGGLPGVLSIISTMMLKAFGPDISRSLENMFYNLTYSTEAARGELRKLRDDAVSAMKSLGDDSIAGSASIDIFTKQGELQDALLLKTREMEQAGKSLTEEETKQAQLLMDMADHVGQQVLKAAELRQEQEGITQTISDRLKQESLGAVDNLDGKVAKIKDLQVIYTALNPVIAQCRDEMDKANNTSEDGAKEKALKSISAAIKEMHRALVETGIDFENLDDDSRKAIAALFDLDGVDFDTLSKKLQDADDVIDAIGLDAQKNFNALKQELLNVEGVDKSGIKKLLDDLKTSLSTTGRLTAEQIQQFKNFGITVDETGKIIEGFKGKTLTFADGLVALGSSLSALSSVIMSIKGLTDIWTDEDLSTGEKMLRTLTTLGMLLPALTTLLNKQNLAKLAGLKIDGKAIVTTLAKIVGVKAEALAEAKTTSAIWAKIGAQMIANWYYAAAVAIILVLVGVISLLIMAYNEEANAAEAAAEKAANLKEAYNEAAQAAEDLKNTISDYSDGVEQLNKLEKGTLEYKQALIEANEKAMELISNYESLAKWATRDENGLIVIDQKGFDEILEAQLMAVDVAQAKWFKAEAEASHLREDSDLVNFSREYKISGQDDWEDTSKQIVTMIANYMKENDLTSLIDEDLEKITGWATLSDEVQSHIRDNITAYANMGVKLNNANRAQENLTAAYIDAEYRLRHPEAELGQDGAANTYDLLHQSLYTTQDNKNLSQEKQDEYLSNYKSENWQEYYDNFVAGNPVGGAGAADAYMTYSAYQNLTGMAGIDDAKEYAKIMGYDTDVEFDVGFLEALGSLIGVGSGGTFNFTKDGVAVESVDSNQLFDVMTDAMAHQYADEYATNEVPKILSDMTTFMGSLGDLDSEALRNLFASGGTLGTDSQLGYGAMSQEMAQYVQANWDTVTQAFTGYTEDIGFWTEMGYDSYQEYLAAAKKWIDDRADLSDGEALGTERVGQIQTATNTVENRVLSGDLTSKNAEGDADFNGLVNGAKQLAQMYPELTEEAEILANTNLVGTEMWMAALHKVQAQANDIKFDNLVKESDKIEKEIAGMFKDLDEPAEIQAVLLSDEFETQLDALLDKNYEIDVEIHAQAEQAFESFSTAANNMRDMASKIGEGYVVAAEDIRELNNVFPGIIQGMENVGDGSVRLNQQVVENAMNSANAEVQASAYSTIEQLENQATILRSKQASYMAMYQAALVLASGEGDLDTASATLKTELANIEALNDQEASNTKMDNAEAVATDSNVQAGIMAQNWDSAYQSAAKSAIEFAKTAVSAAQAAQSGEATYQMGDFGVNYQGRNGQSSEAAQLAQFESAVNEASSADDYAALAQQFLEAANSAGAKANDIEGMIAEIGATGIDLNHLMGNVGDGNGPDGPDDKGGSDKKDKDAFEFDPNQLKQLDEEAERYHEIENSLESIGRELEDIATQKDRAFGKDKLALMNKEEAALKKQIELQKKYRQEIKKNKDDDASVMKKKWGATLDGDDNISNYDEITKKQVDSYNAAYATYIASKNAAVADYNKNKNDENAESVYNTAIKKADAAWEAAQKKYEDFQKDLDQYEESVDLFEESALTLQEMENQLYDLQLEKVDYKVQLQIEFSDDELKYLEYLLERIENKAFSAAEAIANLGKQTSANMNKSDAYKSGIMGIFENHGLTEDDFDKWMAGDEATKNKIAGMSFTEDEIAKLREYTEGLMDTNQAMIDLRQSVHDKILSTFEEMNAEIDKGIDKLKHLQAMTESYGNIIDLVGKANFAGSDEAIKALNASKVAQAGNVANANINKRDMMAANLQSAKDTYAQQYAILSEEERKMWEDSIAEMEVQLAEAEEAAMGSIEDWMQAINDQFVAEIEATMDRFSESVAGKFKNLNELQEAFERKQSENDRYLEDYEKIYEFSKLNRDIEKSIDNSDNIKAKKELADLQAEINELEESGAEISEYQMENLRKRYELKLAELALEEAQNAKSEVRMTRDSEGNWGYVYTADEAQVAEAEQSYEDKLYELQQQNAEYINTLQENIIQMQIEMKEKMAEIANDESLSIEERQQKMNEVQAYYQEQMGYYASEMGIVLDNNKRLYEEDWTTYSDATGYKIAKDEEYVDSFQETDLAILTGFENMEGYQATFNEASQIMLDESNAAFDLWEQTMADGPLAAMNTDFDNLANDIEEDLERIEDESDRITQEIDQDSKDMQDDFEDLMQTIVDWENQYSQSIDNMIADSDLIIAKFQEVLALWADVKAAAAEEPPTPPSSSGDGDGGGGDGSGGGGDGSGGGGGGGGKPSWDRVVAAYDKINQGKWGNGISNRISRGAADGFSEAEVRAGQQLINYTYPPNLNGMGKSRSEAKRLMGYDTGGYTGEWGDQSGKLALLHQKELVLNSEDTANMLAAIDMVRQISSMIDLNAMSSMKGLGALLSAGGVGAGGGNFEQHVEIHASFPDATDHSEIEEAFNNLLNSASQYANRKL
jgi:TP901 family phage tail tape measure protein